MKKKSNQRASGYLFISHYTDLICWFPGMLLINLFVNELLFRVVGKYAHDSQSVGDIDEERVVKKDDVEIFISPTTPDTNFSLLVARSVSI